MPSKDTDTANMNVLYKYCDQVGVEKILETLELKLPYISNISQVNDPYECLPFFYCPDDKPAMKAQWLRTISRNLIVPPDNWEQKLDEQFEKGELKKKLEEGVLETWKEINQKSCLLSVSGDAEETVMWAHYADKHKSAVIGVDFNNIYPDTVKQPGILMKAVNYSKHRPKVNILKDTEEEDVHEAVMTKSISWEYEKEFRTMFSHDSLNKFQKLELVNCKDFKGKKTWFLRLNPKSIVKVVFGLNTDEKLKTKIRELVNRPNLQHVKLYQAEETETYKLHLEPLTS